MPNPSILFPPIVECKTSYLSLFGRDVRVRMLVYRYYDTAKPLESQWIFALKSDKILSPEGGCCKMHNAQCTMHNVVGVGNLIQTM